MDYIKLGRKIKQARTSAGLTQAKLAEKIDLSTAFIGQIERGERKISIETLVSLCNILGVSSDYLLGDSLIIKMSTTKKEIIQMMEGKSEKDLLFSSDILRIIQKYLNK